MTIQKRSMVAGVFFAFALILYGVAKYCSPSIIFYVVEQSLIQKAPPGTDIGQLHRRLRESLSTTSSGSAQMGELLRISMYLEKVQNLKPGELDKLLAIEKF